MITYTLKVINIRIETKDTITLSFKQPGLRKIKYLAGQYLTLIFRINGRRYIRPYSFSSSPAINDSLDVTIKRVANGIVSNHIHDRIQIGDCIEVMQPMGDFIVRETDKTIFLWGVGSGITPLISIAKQLLATSEQSIVNLIYGNRNSESTIFLEQINNLLNIYQKNFVVKHFHTQFRISNEIPDLIEGRINKENAISLLKELECTESSLHYICGPVGLKKSVNDALTIIGVQEKNIFSEDFELIKNPMDFENIQTQNVKLKFEKNEFDLEVVKGKTILESALDSGIELPYSCQTGNCSTCKGRLMNGEARMIGLSKTRDDLMENEYLICCTHPLSHNVYIEII